MPQATFFGFDLHAERAPVLDPVAKLKRRGGDKSSLVLAVELFAVAPKS